MRQRFPRSGKSLFGAIAALCCLASLPAHADTIHIFGTITQSVSDGTGPEFNNPSLNVIQDGDAFSATLTYLGTIGGPGVFGLTDVLFTDVTAGVTESNFTSGSLAVFTSGPSAGFSALGCVGTGSGCNQGNSLSLSFQIPLASLNSVNIPAQAIAGITPLDLLEDDGVTDIQGSVQSVSFDSASGASVPEPSALLLVGFGLIGLGLRLKFYVKQKGKHTC